jgi:hypothetical protein
VDVTVTINTYPLSDAMTMAVARHRLHHHDSTTTSISSIPPPSHFSYSHSDSCLTHEEEEILVGWAATDPLHISFFRSHIFLIRKTHQWKQPSVLRPGNMICALSSDVARIVPFQWSFLLTGLLEKRFFYIWTL